MTSEPTEGKTSGWLQKFVENNIAVLVCGAAVIWSGFNSSDAVTLQRLSEHDRQLEVIGSDLREIRNSLIDDPRCGRAVE
jgi:hypothetical protein